jgi:hypothetical protein
MAEKRVATKPQPRRVPSDDCEVSDGTTTFYPHVGESLWVIGSQTIGEMKARWAFSRLSADMDEIRPDPKMDGESDEAYAQRVKKGNAAGIELIEHHYDDMVRWFAERLAKWDWTDDYGDPLPPLDRTIAPFAKLKPEELFYIKDVLSGDGPAEVLTDASSS